MKITVNPITMLCVAGGFGIILVTFPIGQAAMLIVALTMLSIETTLKPEFEKMFTFEVEDV
jgi:hypothetical protein